MEFQFLKSACTNKFSSTWGRIGTWSLLFSLLFFCFACEKEIEIALPKTEPELVVEAYVNNWSPVLNYVYLSQTIDYFNPNLDLLGVDDANVYITEGLINGSDTLFEEGDRVQMRNVGSIGSVPAGFYGNPLLRPKLGKAYKLEIFYNGKTVIGYTQIPDLVKIVKPEVKFNGTKDDKRAGHLSMSFVDPPEPSYYRLAYTLNRDSLLLGFGAVDRFRNLDDEYINNKEREFNTFPTFTEGDTVHLYLCRLGVKEYKFWQSFSSAVNNDGPFSTPVKLKSTIRGGVGTFTGFAISHEKVLIQ